MKPIVLLLGILASIQLHAQDFSLGLRGGVNRWSNTTGSVEGKANNVLQFSKAIYARYESKGRFAADFETSHYVPDFSNWQFGGKCGNTGYYEMIEEHVRHETFEYTLGLQFRTNRAGSKLNNYVGSLISLHHHYTRHSHTERNVMTMEVRKSSSTFLMSQTMFGINHLLSYNVSRHFNIHSQLSLKLDVINMVERSVAYPDNQFTWQIGCDYTF